MNKEDAEELIREFKKAAMDYQSELDAVSGILEDEDMAKAKLDRVEDQLISILIKS